MIRSKRGQQELQRGHYIQRTVEKYPIPSHFKAADIDWQWLAGWFQGDGCLKGYITTNRSCRLGGVVQIHLSTGQHIKSLYILCAIAQFFGKRYSQVQYKQNNIMSVSLSQQQSIKLTLDKFKGLMFGDKWFDLQACTYVCTQQLQGKAKTIQGQLELAQYIAHHFKGQNKLSDMNAKLKLKQMYEKTQTYFFKNIYCNEVVLYNSHLPKNSLHERFLLGFIEAEGCFHIRLKLRTSIYPLVEPQLIFYIKQYGDKNKFILEDILRAMGQKGSLRGKQGVYYQLDIADQKQIIQFVIPFFLQNMPLSAKYFDFAKFVEIGWGKQAGLNQQMQWNLRMIDQIFSMNTNKNIRTERTTHNIHQYKFYLQLVCNQEEAKLKKRNLKTFKMLIFDWVTNWRYILRGTQIQKNFAIKWFDNIIIQQFKMYSNDYSGYKQDVRKILQFVINQVAPLEKEINCENFDDLQWFEQLQSIKGEEYKNQIKPFQFIISQTDLARNK
eukprot:TRINITY_DN4577_c1_g1_i2.p1 TRINITY_DN4577_c1_g1~~TRINITY_DN4577_c1_g1_i2.p1  ORF type:complete len:496 (+),score=14.42 TRINITY_DN4577_c1_g1_i2:108-1595(+)